MTQRNDGGPAFPASAEQCNRSDAREGMSLRDYFAAKAMQGLMNSVYPDDANWHHDFEPVAKAAYAQADAMLAERESADE